MCQGVSVFVYSKVMLSGFLCQILGSFCSTAIAQSCLVNHISVLVT